MDRHALAIGVVATFAVGIAVDAMRMAHVDGGLATLLVLGLAWAVLSRIFPEPAQRIGVVRSTVLVVAGMAGAGIWLAVIARPQATFSVDSWIDYPIFLLVQIVIAPLYEEKLVRHVLLSGLSRHVGFITAALIVSLGFAALHMGNFATALVFSLIACALAGAGYNTFHRSLLHGSYNAVLVFSQIAGGSSLMLFR